MNYVYFGGRQMGKTAKMQELIDEKREEIERRYGWREALRRVVRVRPTVTLENVSDAAPNVGTQESK